MYPSVSIAPDFDPPPPIPHFFIMGAQNCYADSNDQSTDECASFGDLLAPPTEPAGANCSCTIEEEVRGRISHDGRVMICDLSRDHDLRDIDTSGRS